MTDIDVLIATAEQEIYRGKAFMLIVPSMNGELAVMPGHAPLLALLRPGEVRIVCSKEEPENPCESLDIVVFGGFLEVQPDAVIILADAVERAEDIDADQAQKAVERAKKNLTSPDKGVAEKALLELELAIAKLRVVRRDSRQSLLRP